MPKPPPSRLDRLLRHPRALPAIVLFALLLGLPALALGFYSDDFAQVMLVEQRLPELRGSPVDLYRMVGEDPAELHAFTLNSRKPFLPGMSRLLDGAVFK